MAVRFEEGEEGVLFQGGVRSDDVTYVAIMPRVEYQDLSDNGLTELSLAAIAEHNRLRVLRVSDVAISAETGAKFREVTVYGKAD